MKIKLHFIIILIAALFSGCEDEVSLTSEEFEQFMVVDGTITNEPGPYTIELSLSTPVNEPIKKPYTGCVVTIFEKSGESETLTEVKPGVYKTSENGIRGKVGNSYSIDIQTPDGETYASDYQEMQSEVKIEEITHEIETINQGNNEDNIKGYQFYISTGNLKNNDSYFLWELKETYEYVADYPFYGIMNDGEIERVDSYKYYKCWRTQEVDEIFTTSTLDISSSSINNHPLVYVGDQTKKLQRKYSLLVKQYAVTKESYLYWTQIKEQISEDNILSAEQPYQIQGNVYNPENAKKPALGFFNVASVDTKRIFVEYPRNLNYMKCFIKYDWRPGIIRPASYTSPYYFGYGSKGMGLVSHKCVDCRLEGGKLEPPDFWNEDLNKNDGK